MSLTDVKIKAIKATGKIFKLYDSNGLYLHISKKFMGNKGRVWRYKYKFNNKEKSLTIGSYPAIGLKKARELRNEAYMKLSLGVDPAQQKQDKKLEALKKQNTGKSFREVALSWIEFKLKPNTKRNWKPDTAKKTIRSLENGVFPIFGDKKIHLLSSDDIDEVITPIQERGALEVANRTLKRIDSVFRYGIYKKWCKENPALGRDEFLERHKVKHMAYIKEQDLPVFLRDLESYKGNFVCKSAVEFVLLTYVRTKEIRFATWDEIDFGNKQWHIPAERMKMEISQTIPLCTQALSILESLKPITGNSKYIFASLTAMSKPISENGMLSVIYRMDYKGKTTIHGLRGTFSTIANESLRFRRDVIEASLSHKVDDPVREAYCHATYLSERTENMQIYADYIDALRCGGNVTPIRKQG